MEYYKFVKENKYLALLTIIYLVLYTFNLAKYPHVWGDEAFLCNPAYNLITEGRFGTSILQGWNNIENNTFSLPPVYYLFLGISFKIFGLGVTQGRIISVAFGLISLLFAYKIANKLYNKKIGLITVSLLMFNPVMFLAGREMRMEIAVTAFVLISVYLLIIGLENNSKYYFLFSGIFGGLAILSHPNGLHIFIFVPILLFFILKNKKSDKQIGLFLGGGILISIPYILYILTDLSGFYSQFSTNVGYSGLNILHNIQYEPIRYIRYINLYGGTIIEIPNWFLIKLLLIGGLIGYTLYYILTRREYGDKIILTFTISWCIFISLFTSYNILYLCIVFPFVSIMLASLFYKTKESPSRQYNVKKHIHRIVSIMLLGFLIVNIIYCPTLLYATKDYDYYQITDEIRNIIPENATVIAPGKLWIGMYDYEYHAYQVINLRMMNGEEFCDIMEDLSPEYMILDEIWKNTFTTKPTSPKIINELSKFTEEKCVKIAIVSQGDLTNTIYKIER